MIVRITFGIYGDQFRVDSVKINGNETSDLISASLFTAIYEQTDALSPNSSAGASDTLGVNSIPVSVDQSEPQKSAADAGAAGEEVDIESQTVIVDNLNSYFSNLPDFAFCRLFTCTYQGDGTILTEAELYLTDRSYTIHTFLVDANDLTIISEITAE